MDREDNSSTNGVSWITNKFLDLLVLFVLTIIGGKLRLEVIKRKNLEKSLNASEDNFKTLFATVLDPILIIDAETHRIVEVNEAAVETYGYKYTEFLFMPASVIVEDPKSSAAYLHEVERNGRAETRLRWHKRKDGTKFLVERADGITTWKGKKAILGIISDITDLKHEAEELIKVNELEVASKLAATVAHEFNNPLAVIQGAYELAEDENLSEEARKKQLQKIPKQVIRMRDLVKKILKIQEVKVIDYAAGLEILDIHGGD